MLHRCPGVLLLPFLPLGLIPGPLPLLILFELVVQICMHNFLYTKQSALSSVHRSCHSPREPLSESLSASADAHLVTLIQFRKRFSSGLLLSPIRRVADQLTSSLSVKRRIKSFFSLFATCSLTSHHYNSTIVLV